MFRLEVGEVEGASAESTASSGQEHSLIVNS